MNKLSSFAQKLGPGLLYAGAAIGVSHLIQSTRAGASFGWIMIIVVILANFLKYPFFQYGPRFTSATGKSLLEGYRQLGKWAVWLFLILTLGTMFIIQGAITMVTAGLAKYTIHSSLSIWFWMIAITTAAVVFLTIGKLRFLNKLMKVVMVILAITTIAAAIASFFADIPKTELSPPFSFMNKEHLFFLIAFIGWMPAPIDISVWYSTWSKESNEVKGSRASYLFDFNVGYWGTAFLAICFVILGAFMLHNTGITLSSSAVDFSGQIIEAYTQSLGNWATPIISIAAFTTMFSTTLSVMDGISKVIRPTIDLLSPKQIAFNSYPIWLSILSVGALLLIWNFGSNMKAMVDFATTLSFLTAPILAYLNIRVLQLDEIPAAYRPSKFTKNTSYAGLITLTLFSLVFIWLRFF